MTSSFVVLSKCLRYSAVACMLGGVASVDAHATTSSWFASGLSAATSSLNSMNSVAQKGVQALGTATTSLNSATTSAATLSSLMSGSEADIAAALSHLSQKQLASMLAKMIAASTQTMAYMASAISTTLDTGDKDSNNINS